MKTTEQTILTSQEGKNFHLTKCILKTNSAFQPKCTLILHILILQNFRIQAKISEVTEEYMAIDLY